MDTFKFMKDDWVKEKGGDQLMQVDEYQIVETVVNHNGSATYPIYLSKERYRKLVCMCKYKVLLTQKEKFNFPAGKRTL